MAWRDDQVLKKRLLTVRDLLQAQHLDPDSFDHEVSEDLEGPRQLFMRIIGPGKVGDHETPQTPAELTRDKFPATADDATQPRFSEIVAEGGRSFQTVVARVPVPSEGGQAAVVQIAADTSLDREVLDWYFYLILAVVAATSPLAAATGWYVARAQMKPLETLAEATKRIEQSTLDYRVPLKGLPRELANFGSQFNRMLARLEKAYDGLKRYADNVAHELRTPLNRMQLEMEVALREPRTIESCAGALESNLEECQRLSEIVRSLLFLARAENRQMEIARAPVNLAQRLEKIRAFFEPGASEAGVALKTKCDGGLSANVDDTLFQRAVSNLVANALSHTPSGGSVTLQASASANEVCVEVIDTGSGISPEDQPHVFDRFYRADVENEREGDRVGLGLAIAKSIVVDLHGGQITMQSDPGKGTRLSLHFPRI
jgi:two-component system heavy metal sensor histidine kinase CusS